MEQNNKQDDAARLTLDRLLAASPKEQLEDILGPSIDDVLCNNYTQGDPQRAIELVTAFRDAVDGILVPVVNDRNMYQRIRGANNAQGISCYVDSLLVAMFARLDSFEPILYKTFEQDDKKENLAIMLRLYVNLLRSGKLITTDVTKCLLDTVFNAGWKPTYKACEQQDTIELFDFITEKLSMPLLTLKVEIAHAGQEEKEDDHKFINERMLHVPIPGTPRDPAISLEECLEQYFANSVEVSRRLDRSFSDNKGARKFSVHVETVEVENETPPDGNSVVVGVSTSSSLHSLDGRRLSGSGSGALVDSPVDMEPSSAQDPGSPHTPSTTTSGGAVPTPPRPPISRVLSRRSYTFSSPKSTPIMTPMARLRSGSQSYFASSQALKEATSISVEPPPSITNPSEIETVVPESPTASSAPPPYENTYDGTSTHVLGQETLPAWMFLQLLPFYSDDHGHSTSGSLGIQDYFTSARPILGISLKRYSWTASGQSLKNDRQVLIPQVIYLPSFVADDEHIGNSENGDEPAYGQFKLVLESVVFHRGKSINSGHFVSMVAENPNIRYDAERTEKHERTGSSTFYSSLSNSMSSIGSKKLNKTSSNEEEGDYEHSRRWVLFDDLLPESKKAEVVDYNETMSVECPYLLFYRMEAVHSSALLSSTQRLDSETTTDNSTQSSRVPSAQNPYSVNQKQATSNYSSADKKRKPRQHLRAKRHEPRCTIS